MPQDDKAMLNAGSAPVQDAEQINLEAIRVGEEKLVHGVIVKQKAQYDEMVAQSFGIPMERRNHFLVSQLPANEKAKREHDDNGYTPTKEQLDHLERLMVIHEESSVASRLFWTCIGGRGARSVKLRFTVTPAGDVLVADKPWACGGWVGCPVITTLRSPDGARTIGRVKEDFRFMECCFTCTTYNDIEIGNEQNGFTKRYTLRSNQCCCGRVNNCCGATCFKDNAIYDILNTNGDIVANMTMTYGGSFCRMCGDFNTYTMEFPPETTWEERYLLLTSIVQFDYKDQEQQNNNN